jgi:hypothetical protein
MHDSQVDMFPERFLSYHLAKNGDLIPFYLWVLKWPKPILMPIAVITIGFMVQD